MSEENGKLKLINRNVLFSLSKESYEVAQKTGAIKGEFGERMQHHKDASNLDLWAARCGSRSRPIVRPRRNRKLKSGRVCLTLATIT